MEYIALIYNDNQKKIIKNKSKYTKYNLLASKKFYLYNEAQKWINNINILVDVNEVMKNKSIFCDSGTNILNVIEIKVIYKNINILEQYFSQYINFRKNLFLDATYTNNFGELLALNISLNYALKHHIKYICSDSAINICYWIQNFFSLKNNKVTKILINQTIKLYNNFTQQSGKIFLIRSNKNLADLK